MLLRDWHHRPASSDGECVMSRGTDVHRAGIEDCRCWKQVVGRRHMLAGHETPVGGRIVHQMRLTARLHARRIRVTAHFFHMYPVRTRAWGCTHIPLKANNDIRDRHADSKGIYQIQHEIVVHDAAITHVSETKKGTRRCGSSLVSSWLEPASAQQRISLPAHEDRGNLVPAKRIEQAELAREDTGTAITL